MNPYDSYLLQASLEIQDKLIQAITLHHLKTSYKPRFCAPQDHSFQIKTST
jgi:hypothetical protein